jgi:glycerophosphoryl diester phosphodiesterase
LSTYPRIIAHRCGGALAPENTLAGLEAAARLGCRAVEFDVMLTADGIPILMHDETLERTTRCTGRVAARTLAEIRACDDSVPTLAEAMDACRRHGFWVNVEIKPSAGREEETGIVVGDWLSRHWDGHGVVSSFAGKSALAARRALPAAGFALLCEALPDDWCERCARLDATAVHLAATAATPEAVGRLRAAGLAVACYTVNRRDAAEHLLAQGVAGIFTDRPDLWSPDEMLASQ